MSHTLPVRSLILAFNYLTKQNEPYPTGEQLDAGERCVVRDVDGRMVALDPPDELRNDDEQDDDEEGGDVKEEQPLEETEVGRHACPKLSLDRLQGGLPQFQRVEQFGHTSLDMFPALRKKTCSDIFNNDNKVTAIKYLHCSSQYCEKNNYCLWLHNCLDPTGVVRVIF